MVDDQRSSLLSILSKVKQQQRHDGSSAPLNAEDRESITSFLRKQQVQGMGDDFQPNLQMFESLVSMVSQNTPVD